MNNLGEPTYFLINVFLLLIVGVAFFGVNAFIVFGLVFAPLGLFLVVSLFVEALTGENLISIAHNFLAKTTLGQKLGF